MYHFIRSSEKIYTHINFSIYQIDKFISFHLHNCYPIHAQASYVKISQWLYDTPISGGAWYVAIAFIEATACTKRAVCERYHTSPGNGSFR